MAWKNQKEDMLIDENNSSSINLIGAGTIVKGDVSSDGDLRIDGKVVGTITSKSKVVVGATGVVEGEIKSQNADVFGTHKGNVNASEMVFLKSTANLLGDINTNKIVIEAGAIFKGRCNMGTAVSATTLKSKELGGSAIPEEEKIVSSGIGSNSIGTSGTAGKGYEKIFS